MQAVKGYVRQIAILLVVAFLLYAIVKSPVQSAHVVRSAWHGIHAMLLGLGNFFDALLGQ